MKCWQRLSLLSFCLLFLFFAFSPVVNAEEIDGYHIYATAHVNGSTTIITGMQHPFDGVRQTLSYNKTLVANDGFKVAAELYLSKSDKTALYNKGNIVNGRLENIYIDGSINLPSVATYAITMKNCSVSVIYADGSIDYIACSLTKGSNGYYTVDFNFEAKKDVTQLFFQLSTNEYAMVGGKSVNINLFMGEPTLETEPNTNISWSVLSSEVQSPEVGWLAKIWNKLTSGFESIANAIVNLPENLWNVISEGLHNLFVPSDEYMTQYKDKWVTLMEENMGAVWQVVDITFGAWEEIGVSDEQNTIALPLVTIPLPGDNEFSFGGYDVKVVPDGFEFLVTILKGAVGMVCTIAFINGLRKRYDEVMGVEK